jgi:LuxR family maltose regulon positive regulatory protein
MDALGEALSLAEPGGYLRVFLDEGEPMAGLLRQAASRGIAPAYVAKLLAAFEPESAEGAAPQPQPLVEPLSERELEVLRLLAAGLSNPEIAEELVVAVSTVRSHCKSIYGKLGVHRRWDAVQQAQELGLI